MEHYDVIIIGTGSGGGTLAYKLAPSGKKILILERGDFIPREKENWDTEEVFLKGRYKAKENWTDKKGKSFQPGIHYCVGGNTKVYGAALLRMREEDFGEVKHHGGISPAWPISYQDLAAYYLEAEQLYAVHGERGSDPTEPADASPYPKPPLKHEPRIQQLYDDMKELGLNPFPLPLGLRTDASNNTAPYVLDRFDGFPDPTERKADAHVVGINAALASPNVTLRTNCTVNRLATNESGTEIKQVNATLADGTAVSFTGNIVVVSCGAINSAALLLRSKSNQHPNGLANGSGVVGRHYMAHNNSALLAISTKPNLTKFGKTFAVNDFYFGEEGFDYPMGHIQMLGKSDPVMYKEEAGFAPGFTLEYLAKHAIDFWMTSEDLPDPENRVMIDSNGNIQLHYKENNLEGHKRLQKKLKWILEHVGCEKHLLPNNIYLGKKIPLAGTAHQCGTIRFGNDPKTSALDTWCRSHEVSNLFVVDGSFFPSSSAVNPSLTINAMALRVGDYLLNEI